MKIIFLRKVRFSIHQNKSDMINKSLVLERLNIYHPVKFLYLPKPSENKGNSEKWNSSSEYKKFLY